MYTIKATFTGQVPLMMDRFYNPEEVEQGGAKHRGKDAWKMEWRNKAYRDAKGIYVPADNIRMMLLGNKFRPGAAKILGSYIQKGKATQYLSMCKGAIWVLGPKDPQKVYVDPARKGRGSVIPRPVLCAGQPMRSICRRAFAGSVSAYRWVVLIDACRNCRLTSSRSCSSAYRPTPKLRLMVWGVSRARSFRSSPIRTSLRYRTRYFKGSPVRDSKSVDSAESPARHWAT